MLIDSHFICSITNSSLELQVVALEWPWLGLHTALDDQIRFQVAARVPVSAGVWESGKSKEIRKINSRE